MYYINYKYKSQPVETIDSAETREEARYLLNEYGIAFGEGTLSISKKQY